MVVFLNVKIKPGTIAGQRIALSYVFSRSLNSHFCRSIAKGLTFDLRHTLYPGVYVMRAYVFRPINTKQEAQVAGLNATPSLEGGISSTASAL